MKKRLFEILWNEEIRRCEVVVDIEEKVKKAWLR
jgi:hypothetical protein